MAVVASGFDQPLETSCSSKSIPGPEPLHSAGDPSETRSSCIPFSIWHEKLILY
jgi:hypothetical protein